ncbi:hypothetical protein BOTBODRAFT_103426 [Botryobasidium botryosum FD-172 SS1]|uniref:ER membrane protein SH3 n=1 Tax=Botryobasidium botryosum (strain FD-172 SS1) TaxID=930990 RepID=A0A067MTE5_BOTB1|nr:hypothetical protein BOTBODRAFT_103426 [Botryobasidium botryosum FD-172 SS1]
MGFRTATILTSVSFLLGVLFINFNVDQRVLYNIPTDASVEQAFEYYKTFFNAPPAAMLHAMMAVGIVGIIAKLHVWDESAMFFDGSSLALFLFGVILYIAVAVPTLRTIVEPLAEDTYEDRVEAVRVLAAGNTITILCLLGVLVMQGGQAYARRTEEKALRKLEEEERKKAVAGKKDE